MTPAPDWQAQFDLWLTPFLARLSRKPQRRWAPVYLQGLLGPGERKSVEPMAARVAPGDVQQLHHFVSTSPWDTAPLEEASYLTFDPLERRRQSRADAPFQAVGDFPFFWR